MMKLLLLIASAAGLLLRFVPGGMVARLTLWLVNHWRAVLIAAAVAAIFGLGARAGYLGGYTRGVNTGFAQGVAHHERLVAEENARRARAAVASEAVVNAETDAVRKAEPTVRAAKRRLCELDRTNCRDSSVRKSRKARKLVRRRQLANDQGDQGSERASVGLLR